MKFEIIGQIAHIEVIASGSGVRVRRYLRRTYGPGKWRKMKGFATVQLPNGARRKVEIHWYETHSLGRKELKIKRYLEKS